MRSQFDRGKARRRHRSQPCLFVSRQPCRYYVCARTSHAHRCCLLSVQIQTQVDMGGGMDMFGGGGGKSCLLRVGIYFFPHHAACRDKIFQEISAMRRGLKRRAHAPKEIALVLACNTLLRKHGFAQHSYGSDPRRDSHAVIVCSYAYVMFVSLLLRLVWQQRGQVWLPSAACVIFRAAIAACVLGV